MTDTIPEPTYRVGQIVEVNIAAATEYPEAWRVARIISVHYSVDWVAIDKSEHVYVTSRGSFYEDQMRQIG